MQKDQMGSRKNAPQQPQKEGKKEVHIPGKDSGQHSTPGQHKMKAVPAADSKLERFLVDELKDLYWAEQKLVKTLPVLQKAATSPELQQAFGSHLKETEMHVQRLEKAFALMGEQPEAQLCEAMDGITKEGDTIIEDTEAGTATRDVGLIMAGQKAEHYEIASYGGLIQLAKTIGHEEIADLLEMTLQEEKNADQKLTAIAEGHVNYEAASES